MSAATLGFLGRHELRLAWRDALFMLRAGGRGRIGVAIALALFIGVLHLVAWGMLRTVAEKLAHPDKAFLLTLSGSAFLAWTLLLSQAMETVTRGFYARGDLELILSSPTSARRLFAIRICGNALSTSAMAALLVGPAVDVAAFLAGPRLLLAYGVVAAMGISALAVAVAATALLFRVVGPHRTRLVAQIVAAVVGAGFVVGIQAAAIISTGSLSRTAMLQSPAWVAAAPDLASPAWWPARAALGEPASLVAVLALALALLVAAIRVTAPAFARHATSVAGLAEGAPRDGGRKAPFRALPRERALRWKELALLWRDPWLVSQSLMQVLYLLPPALLLWRDYGSGIDRLVVLVPVLVMAAGQLAGGLAWLAISGEDAPDLIATAPMSASTVLRAKIEAVALAVALPILPLASGLALVSPRVAGITLLGAMLATAGASAVQFLFRAQAKRSNFRRRQTSSRVATFAEAFLSIALAAAAGFAAAGLWEVALIPAAVAFAVLGAARVMAGPGARHA